MIRIKPSASTLVIVLIFLIAAAVQAQETLAQDVSGSISGVVFRDLNENGLCTDEDEPGVVGIPLQLVNRDDNTIVNLSSGGEGFYELVDASAGTWQVTVNPGAGWRVTSQQTRQVLIDEDEPDVEEVDFCIVEVAATVTPAQSPTPATAATPVQPIAPTPSPVLPQSGAAISPAVAAAAVLGLLLLLSGAGLLLRTRKNNGNG